MKLNFSSSDLEKVNKLLETKEINISIADMLMSFYQFDLSKIKVHSNNEFLSIFMDALELDSQDEENISFVNSYIGENLKKLDDSIFLNNPYFKKVRPQLQKIEKYELCLDHFYPNQAFAYDDVEIDENNNFVEKYKIGYFDHKVNFLALSYNKEIWMNISPNEINTMHPSIDKAHGDVLVYGLGLGYYPFMISLKENVNKIIIVEKDKNIIDIFNKYLLYFFPQKQKIQIIQSDAFEYEKNHIEHYDYTFVDLWHNPVDGLPLYLDFKKLERKDTEYSYWLDKSIKAMYRRCFLTVLEEQLNGSKDSDYLNAENDIDKIINDIYFKTKNLEIDCFDKLMKILKEE